MQVSLPYNGDSTVSMMNKMYSILERDLCCLNLWQVCVHDLMHKVQHDNA